MSDETPNAPPTTAPRASIMPGEAAAGGGIGHRVRRFGRGLIRIVLLTAIAAGAWEAGAWWYAETGRYVTTENAYVKAPVIAVSPNIDGRTIEVLVRDNQQVAKGAILFRINPAPHQVRLKRAEARRAAVVNELRATRAELGQVTAEMAEMDPRMAFYAKEVARQQQLVSRAVATEARLDEVRMEQDIAVQRLRALDKKREVILARLGGAADHPIEKHPLVLEAEAEIERVQLDLGDTEIRAPAAGTVTRMTLQAGERVEADVPTFGIVATGKVWIEANMKETRLGAITLGQPVRITVDAYPEMVWQGRVESLSPATGAEFSALPPQNASGNWVKVVQRLPVSISVEQPPGKPRLRAGMSAVISVDTGRERTLGATVAGFLASFLPEGAASWIGKATGDFAR